MKTVLWISRHEMTEAQLRDLERVMGGPVSLLPHRDSVTDPSLLREEVGCVDAIAAVLPPELLAELLKLAGRKPLLRSLAGREPTGRIVISPAGRPEPEFRFVHLGWEQVLRVEIVTKKL